MLWRAAVLRKAQAASALAAVVVAAAAATAMLNLYVDVQEKLRKEFRNFGANLVIEAKPGQSTPEMLRQIESSVGNHGFAVPFAYAVARMENGQPIVIAGTDFDLVRKLNSWWSVSAWPKSSGEALVGVRASELLVPQGGAFTLNFQGHPLRLSPAGTLHTGAGEDSRVYLSLQDFQAWTGQTPSVIEINASGSAEDVSALLRQLQHEFPASDVHAVRQVTEGEANILGKTRSTLLSSAAFIVCTAALCVLATLMGWIFDRRRDFAIMKALGASDWLITSFVGGETVILASVGALLGFGAGVGIAAWIGRVNFHAPVVPRFGIFPEVLLGSILVTLLATLIPLRLLRRIQPAMILRGE
jgi:putative ABC transport system permease protein